MLISIFFSILFEIFDFLSLQINFLMPVCRHTGVLWVLVHNGFVYLFFLIVTQLWEGISNQIDYETE